MPAFTYTIPWLPAGQTTIIRYPSLSSVDGDPLPKAEEPEVFMDLARRDDSANCRSPIIIDDSETDPLIRSDLMTATTTPLRGATPTAQTSGSLSMAAQRATPPNTTNSISLLDDRGSLFRCVQDVGVLAAPSVQAIRPETPCITAPVEDVPQQDCMEDSPIATVTDTSISQSSAGISTNSSTGRRSRRSIRSRRCSSFVYSLPAYSKELDLNSKKIAKKNAETRWYLLCNNGEVSSPPALFPEQLKDWDLFIYIDLDAAKKDLKKDESTLFQHLSIWAYRMDSTEWKSVGFGPAWIMVASIVKDPRYKRLVQRLL